MAQLLFTGKIDLTKIDKTKLFKSDSTGSIYLDLTIWVNEEEDDYGNKMSIQQQLTKEEREAGASKIYLGNCKLMTSGANLSPATAEEVENLF